MPILNLNEETALRLAPDNTAIAAARDLIRKRQFQNLGVSSDGTWLLAECQGSGKNPYVTSVDLADPDQPTFRCTCPSRKFPCKHGLGLLLCYAQSSSTFGTREPDADLLAKREKKAARGRKTKPDETSAAPKKVNLAALAKKTAAQRAGLDLLEKIVVDTVAAGQWFESARLDKIERLSKQLTDAYLPGAMVMLRRLSVLGRQTDLTNEQRQAESVELLSQLWAAVRKGRNYLDGKMAGDESQAEADAVVEDLLGKVWQLTELREKGCFRSQLSLWELAYERFDDQAAQQRVEISHLLDLKEGQLLQAISYRPFKGMKFIAEQPSYSLPIEVTEAAIYPGFLNRRVRWEKGAEKTVELKPTMFKAALSHAREFKPALDAFRQQMRHPLAPRSAVMLLRTQRIGTVGERVVLEDAKSDRIVVRDEPESPFAVANLIRAAGELGSNQPAVLVRLRLLPTTNQIEAVPLAMLSAKKRLHLALFGQLTQR